MKNQKDILDKFTDAETIEISDFIAKHMDIIEEAALKEKFDLERFYYLFYTLTTVKMVFDGWTKEQVIELVKSILRGHDHILDFYNNQSMTKH